MSIYLKPPLHHFFLQMSVSLNPFAYFGAFQHKFATPKKIVFVWLGGEIYISYGSQSTYANIMLQIKKYGVIHLGDLSVISSKCKSPLCKLRAIYLSVYNVFGLRHHVYNDVMSAVPTSLCLTFCLGHDYLSRRYG